jgi:isochorismate hydrolase
MEYELGLQNKKNLSKLEVFQNLNEDYTARPSTSLDQNRALKERFLANKLESLNKSTRVLDVTPEPIQKKMFREKDEGL